MSNVHICSHITGEAIFHDEKGRPVYMEFHSYCGPMFIYADREDGGFIPGEESVLWEQFDKWESEK